MTKEKEKRMLSPLVLHKLVVGLFEGLARYSIRHPKRVILIAVSFTLAVAPGALRLTLRTDGHALVAANAPEVLYDNSIRAEFGIEDPIVVVVRSPHADGIYNGATLQLVRELTADFIKLEGIHSNNVVSLATERGFRTRPGTLLYQTLLETPRQTKEELDQLKDDLRRIELYTGTIVSFDGKCAAILIGTPAGIDRTQLYKRIRDIITAKGTRPEEIAVTGPPVAEALLGAHILEDLGVPAALLGASTRSAAAAAWKVPRNLYEVRLFIAQHLGLVPISVVLMGLIFQISFHRILASILPLAEVAACLLFIFGLMGWFHVPIYLTIAVMPVLLTAMAVTDEIHVYSRYFALLHENPGVDHRKLVQETIDEMVCPVVNTSLTTAVGFISFAFSPLGPVVAFGLFTGIGVLFCLFWSLSVMPAFLTVIDPARLRARGGHPEGAKVLASKPWFGRFALGVVRHRYWVAGLVGIILVLTPLGLQRLVIQDSWIDGFDPSSEFSRTTRLVNEQFHGMHLLHVTMDAGETLRGRLPVEDVAYAKFFFPTNLIQNPRELAGRWLYLSTEIPTNSPPRQSWFALIESGRFEGDKIVVTTQIRDSNSSFWLNLPVVKSVAFEIVSQPFLQPQMMRTIAEFSSFIEQRRQYKVGKVISPADYVSTTRFMVRPNEPGSRKIPDTVGEVRLMWDYYRIVRGPEQLRHVVATNYSRALLTIFLKEANFVDTAKLMDDIRAYEKEHLAAQHIRIGFAGDVAVSQSLIRGIVTTQLQSLFWSLVGIYAVTALLGRSLRWGIYCVVPSTLAVLINFAVMGWMNIPLGVATSMFAGMTLGIGVDFAIHVLEGFGLARAGGLSTDNALRESMARTGPAVVINTLAIALGFGVLTLSQVPANSRLGTLTILGIVNCLVASLLLLPVLLHWWPLGGGADQTKGTVE